MKWENVHLSSCQSEISSGRIRWFSLYRTQSALIIGIKYHITEVPQEHGVSCLRGAL